MVRSHEVLENNGLKIRDFDYNAFFKKRLDRNFKFNFKIKNEFFLYSQNNIDKVLIKI
jgi:hypothetical protein